MHTHNLDLDISLEEITKIEGTATCTVEVRSGKVTACRFAITEMRRFFGEAVIGKPMASVPGQVARVCGTCSNAHLLCSLAAIENALGLQVSPQVILLRKLLNYGLIIRDHALHLYVFCLPDLFARDSILSFDENNPEEHRLLDDCFSVKNTGNRLGTAIGGRSVHAPFPRIGGFSKIPTRENLAVLVPELEKIRPAILYLIETFATLSPQLSRELQYIALNDPAFSFLSGDITADDGQVITPQTYLSQLKPVDNDYSQARGYRFRDRVYMVGALSRINLFRQNLHHRTRADCRKWLEKFPTNNIFFNNVAQAIEILHAVDSSIDLINSYRAADEPAVEIIPRPGTGYGIIEAPRGLLYHEVKLDGAGNIESCRIVVPTGQNQIGIEEAIAAYIGDHLDMDQQQLEHKIEEIIRAYDPCMSCATHFLKLRIAKN